MIRVGLKFWSLFIVLAALSGCSSDSGFKDLDRFMKEARNAPRGVVEPLPEFKAYEAFTYKSANRRSPFEPPVDVELAVKEQQKADSNVKPDENRPKEPLEQYSLSDLKMVGTLKRAESDELWALVSDAEGGIHRVRPGNHMGKNYGRVVNITDTRMELIEIVPNGQGGWVERPRTLSLSEG
ncbi:pilus assembly protein PilP [Marinobacteraceae bacterium S3BR75-40.1]